MFEYILFCFVDISFSSICMQIPILALKICLTKDLGGFLEFNILLNFVLFFSSCFCIVYTLLPTITSFV